MTNESIDIVAAQEALVLSRRTFLKGGSAIAGAFTLEFSFPLAAGAAIEHRENLFSCVRSARDIDREICWR